MSRQFAELLLKENLISQEQFKRADDNHKSTKEGYFRFFIRNNFIDEKKILQTFSKKYSVPSFDLSRYEIPPDVTKLLNREQVNRYRLMPVQKAKGTLVVVLADPTALQNLGDIKFRTQLQVEAVLTTYSAFETAVEKYYGVAQELEHAVQGAIKQEKDADQVVDIGSEGQAHDIGDAGDIDAPIIQLVNSILLDAIKRKASDIHVEPYEKTFRIRMRVDGALHETLRPPSEIKTAVVARLKIMAKLDISEKRLPQDGRIKIRTPLGEMDFRVSSMPTLFGEKVVLRLLNKEGLNTDLTKFGFEKKSLELFNAAIHEPYGMVLVTGPTGSGKTTTLYSALSELNKVSDNISTAEDPVEYNLEGINQLQTHSDIGLTFASALRSFLRQDPDIILVGEIRDFETAEVAIQAALTGHLVLSTLHTNDAPSTITRLLNMGVEPFLITASLHLVLAQRLVRAICKNCKVETKVPLQQLLDLGIDEASAKNMRLYKGRGCENCSNTGYRGRLGLYEVMPFTSKLKEAVLQGSNSLELKKMAMIEGMKTLRMAGLTKVAEGLTTLEEALANTTSDL